MNKELAVAANHIFYDYPRRVSEICQKFGSWSELQANFTTYVSRFAYKPETITQFENRLRDFNYDDRLHYINNKKMSLLFIDDPQYPADLKELFDAPPVLFYKGDISCLEHALFSIVGSRKCSAYGRQMARAFSQKLGPYFSIISGMASGIDTAGHRGALASGYSTIAVVGTGLDSVYPRENTRLFEEICGSGLVLSEFPPGVTALGKRFPQRNRIISALAKGVLVIEAGQQSGALITARLAAEYGKDIYVIPSQIDQPFSQGSHRLIQEGAKLVCTLPDILEEFPVLEKKVTAPSQPSRSEKRQWPFMTAHEKTVMTVLEKQGCSTDSLVEKTGLSIVKIMKSLSILELNGLIEKNAPNCYQLKV